MVDTIVVHQNPNWKKEREGKREYERDVSRKASVGDKKP